MSAEVVPYTATWRAAHDTPRTLSYDGNLAQLALDSTVNVANDGPFEACAFWEGTDYLIPSF
jgi:hypothetical protein